MIYNFGTIEHGIRIWIPVVMIGVLLLLLRKFWPIDKTKKSETIIIILLIIMSICKLTLYVIALKNPSVDIYDGSYSGRVNYYRQRALYTYCFIDANGNERWFETDRVTMEELLSDGFHEGQVYRIHYEEKTEAIVGVEKIE